MSHPAAAHTLRGVSDGDCPSFCVWGRVAWLVVLVGQSVSEVDLEASEGAGPVVGLFPRSFGSQDGEVDQLGGGLFVGEVAAGLDRLADLAVEVLDAVGGVDGAAQVGGQGQE